MQGAEISPVLAQCKSFAVAQAKEIKHLKTHFF